MMEDSTLFSVSPEAYAEYLEQLSDTAFWHHAREKAHMPYSTHPTQALITVTAQPENTLTCLTCELRAARCVIPLTSIREILSASQRFTLLPDVPFWMLGILSWRNETLAAIDLCSYSTQSTSSPMPEHITLIVQHEGLSLALCVLSVVSTLSYIDTNQIVPLTLPLDMEGYEAPIGLAGMLKREDAGQEVTLVLDMAGLFKDVMQSIERKAHHE